MANVRFPEMRGEVVGAIQALADPEYQWRVWVRREFPQPNFYDDFTMCINMLDDLRVLEDPKGGIGDVLRTEEEAQAIVPLSQVLRELFDKRGTDLTDEEYLNVPEWPAVVDAARGALSVLTEPGTEG